MLKEISENILIGLTLLRQDPNRIFTESLNFHPQPTDPTLHKGGFCKDS